MRNTPLPILSVFAAMSAAASQGTLTVNNKTFDFEQVTAFTAANPFDEEVVDIQVVYTNAQIPPDALREPFGLQTFALDHELDYIALTLESVDGLNITHCEVRAADFSLQLSGSTPIAFSDGGSSQERILGQFSSTRESEFRGTTWSFEGEIDDAITQIYRPPSQRGGTAVPPGGGAPGRAYSNYVKAVRAGDLDGIRGYLTGRRADMAADPSFSSMVPRIQDGQPKKMKIVGGTDYGGSAELEITGELEGQPITGTVEMVRDDDRWKVAHEKWRF